MDAISEIYDAVGDDAAFARLPDVIAGAANARSAMLQVFDRSWEIRSANLNYFSEDMLARYMENDLWRMDPWKGPSIEKLNRLIHMEDVAPANQVVRSEFFRENFHFWGDDTAQCLAGAFATGDGFISIGVHRGQSAKTFSELEFEQAKALIPHILRMFELRARLDSASTRAVLSEGALNSQRNAVFVVDRSGRPQFMNAAGKVLALRGEGVALTKVGLRALRASDASLLQRAIETACARVEGHGGALRISRPTGKALRVAVSPLAVDGRTFALVVVNDPAKLNPGAIAALRGYYGLTLAEAETAAALARGLSPAQIAEERAVAMTTTRSQIRQILEKTEARGLAEIAALVASAPTTWS